MQLAARAGLVSVALCVLRMELDSMVRAVFLLSKPNAERLRLLAESADGKRWTAQAGDPKKHVTDRMMVELASQLHGWTRSVYLFGCAFVHLSKLHDYGASDPVRAMPRGERRALLEHLRYYHGGPLVPDDDATLADLLPLLPRVLDKIAGNLEAYLKDLEAGRSH
jgi:hypothetical protein